MRALLPLWIILGLRKLTRTAPRHPISKIGICHLIIDELWFSFRQPASYGYQYTARQQNYSNHQQFSKYLFYHHGHAGDIQCERRSHFVRYRSFLASETLRTALNEAGGGFQTQSFSKSVTLKTALSNIEGKNNFSCWCRDNQLTRGRLSLGSEVNSIKAVSDHIGSCRTFNYQ